MRRHRAQFDAGRGRPECVGGRRSKRTVLTHQFLITLSRLSTMRPPHTTPRWPHTALLDGPRTAGGAPAPGAAVLLHRSQETGRAYLRIVLPNTVCSQIASNNAVNTARPTRSHSFVDIEERFVRVESRSTRRLRLLRPPCRRSTHGLLEGSSLRRSMRRSQRGRDAAPSQT